MADAGGGGEDLFTDDEEKDSGGFDGLILLFLLKM